MKVCPRCSETNAPDAPVCRRCHAALDVAPRICPAGRHMMDPTWTECAYCRSDSACWGGANPAKSSDLPGIDRGRATVNEAGPNGYGAPAPAHPETAAVPPAWTPSAPAPQFGPGLAAPRPPEFAPARGQQTMSESEFRRALGIIDNRLEQRPEPAPPGQPPHAAAFRQSLDPTLLPPASVPRDSPASEPAPPPGSRRTVFVSPQDAAAGGSPAPRSAGEERRIVGLLLTYTWKPGGQVFPLREGRNLIGRDPERCDIALPDDATLSAVNTHITYRRSFIIGDNVSMGGTDVNGRAIEEQFVALPNYARIRTGSTQWIFLMVDPAVAEEPAPPPLPEVKKEETAKPEHAVRKGPHGYQ